MATKTAVKTSIDLKESVRDEMVALCNQQLADTFDLYSQTKQAHWNVKGPEFMQLHKLYDDLAEAIFEFVDMIAERATALGGVANGTSRMAAANTTLEEFPEGAIDGIPSLEVLVDRYASYAASTRAAIEAADSAGDMSTADLFTEISREADKALWFLEAHLQSA